MGYVAALWGFVGIFLLIGSAVVRLGDIGLQTFNYPLEWHHWLVMAFSIVFMGFAEGYRGFQKAWAPRVAARIHYLSKHTTPIRLVLAPLFCMGFFTIERRRMLVTYCLTFGIILMVLLVHKLEQPWRGVVDLGVITGLIWGLTALLIFTVKAFFTTTFQHSPEIPHTIESSRYES